MWSWVLGIVVLHELLCAGEVLLVVPTVPVPLVSLPLDQVSPVTFGSSIGVPVFHESLHLKRVAVFISRHVSLDGRWVFLGYSSEGVASRMSFEVGDGDHRVNLHGRREVRLQK